MYSRHVSLWLKFLCLVFALTVVAGLAEAQSRRKKKATDEGDDPAARATEILWRHDLSSALAEGAAVGKGVFADFTADWCGFCKKLDAETFSDPNVIRAINTQFIPVKVDIDVDQAAKRAYEVRGVPNLIFIKPDGTEAHRIGGFVDAETFKDQTEQAVKKIGVIAAEGEAEKLQRGRELARKAQEKGRFGPAYSLYAKLVETGQEGLPEVKEAKEQMQEIADRAANSLEEVKKLIDQKDYSHVAGMLDELVDSYEGVPAGDEAKGLRDEIMSDPSAKRALREAKAERIYEETREDIERRRYGLALTRLEGMVKEYADLPIGARFKTELTRLQSDDKIVRAARDETARTQCNAWLSLARTWSKNPGNERAMTKARGYYRQIIETFPGTTFAKTAQEEVVRLRDESA